jgi:hypothetical protein
MDMNMRYRLTCFDSILDYQLRSPPEKRGETNLDRDGKCFGMICFLDCPSDFLDS